MCMHNIMGHLNLNGLKNCFSRHAFNGEAPETPRAGKTIPITVSCHQN